MFKKLNKVILCLTLSDSFTWGPLVIISNLAGLYLAENLGQDIVSFIGIGTGIYLSLIHILYRHCICIQRERLQKEELCRKHTNTW